MHKDFCHDMTEKSTSVVNSQCHPNLVFHSVVGETCSGLKRGEGLALSDTREYANQVINAENAFQNRELKVLLISHYGEEIRFAPPAEADQSVMMFLETCTAVEMADVIRASNPVRECAEMIGE